MKFCHKMIVKNLLITNNSVIRNQKKNIRNKFCRYQKANKLILKILKNN